MVEYGIQISSLVDVLEEEVGEKMRWYRSNVALKGQSQVVKGGEVARG